MSQLESTLKQLRLSGLLQTLDVRLQEATANRLGHAEFLELICQDELNVRQQRQMERRTKAADFRGLKTLEDFDWSFYPASQGRSFSRPARRWKNASGPGHWLRSHQNELPGALPFYLRSGARLHE